MKKYISGWNSITKRIVLTLILLILPFNVVSIVTTMYSLRNARLQTLSAMENLSVLAMQQLDSRLAAMNDLFYGMDRTNAGFRLYKAQGIRDGSLVMAETELASYFNTVVENKAFADVLFWKSTEYDRIYIGMDGLENHKTDKAYAVKGEIRDFLEEGEIGQYSHWKIAEIGDMTWLMKCYIYGGGFYYGSMISLDEVEHNLRKSSSFKEMQIVFSDGEEEAEVPDGLLWVERRSESGNFRMQMRVPQSERYTSLPPFQMMCFGFAFLYILLIPLLIYLIHRMVLLPLKSVSRAMERLRNGEQDYRMEVNGRDAEEFAAVGRTFNDMADRIRDLRIANYEKELERQRVELRNLQLQIRPHFLMNMFNLLYSFAQIENYQNIQKLALYLSEYFRYLFQNGRDLQPFRQELNLIRKYMEIAALRYPDCCETVYEIDPEALEVEVPPLLLHNFVENIFKHIVDYDRKLHLRVEAYTDGQEATFLIADDGPGMEPWMVEDINCGNFVRRKDGRVHVGIENSYRRLKYFYGEKGSLTVESELGQGTCFSVIIPIH